MGGVNAGLRRRRSSSVARGFPQAYLAASLDAVEAVLMALWARPRLGKGQYADVSARDGVIFTESEMIPYWTMMGENPSGMVAVFRGRGGNQPCDLGM